jgi:NAD(P)-dependent dehydrogenase (short-subunit alcohol dehydrogenase family)
MTDTLKHPAPAVTFSYSGRVVMITGAAGGIGLGLVRFFLGADAKVIACDRDSAGLERLAQELGHPSNLHVAVADITDSTTIHRAVESASSALGEIDTRINSAGAAAATALVNLTAEGWDHDIAVNLTGAYNCVEAVRPAMMRRRRGIIINIGSVNGMTALGHPAYSAAKAGLISYTKSLAIEFGPFGIRANIICPGTVRTQAWTERARKRPEIFDSLRKWYPLREIPTAEDIAAAAAFLASDAARAITGVVLPVDSGLSAGNPVLAAELTLERF